MYLFVSAHHRLEPLSNLGRTLSGISQTELDSLHALTQMIYINANVLNVFIRFKIKFDSAEMQAGNTKKLIFRVILSMFITH